MFKKMNRNSSMIISVIHRRPYCQITSSWSFLVYSVSFILCLMNIPSVLSIKTKQQSQNLCFDLRQNCKELAKNNQCNNNSLWMSSHCPVSCNTCHLLIQLVSIDESFNDIKYRTDGKTIPAWGSDIGIPQIISDDKIIDNNMKEKIIEILERARSYVNNNILVDKKYDIVREKCRNYNESCVEWAFDGWCEDDPTYMSKDCGPTCRSCDLLHVDLKCPLPHINDVMNGNYFFIILYINFFL